MTIRLFVISILVSAAASLTAGQLSPGLVHQLNAGSPDASLKVWIKLAENSQADPLRSASMPAATVAEQHRSAITALKSSRASDQASLADRLQQLARSGKAKNIRQHWLVNVVEVEIAPSELAALAARGDIETIYSVPRIKAITPIAESSLTPEAPLADSITDNLKHIKADQAHLAGFTGSGRVVCSFDTGIEGAHQALQNSWKGKGGTRADSAAAWFDPVYHSLAPHTIAGDIHGTHTMGLMVGRDPVKNIVYGVAPGAKWISAGIIDVPGASIIDAFEWAADPDGDPNTIDDVPDVINHSWGYEDQFLGCENIFFDMIDKTEALGIVNIFAAGNFGPSAESITNPANRALDSIDCFAVGMINTATTPPTVDGRSSRGPSLCNGDIKPNVVAPGVSIMSTVPFNSYTLMSGTSMAAPQVSGLVALLRQKNPAATVQQIKTAILNTTQKFTWNPPNDSVGWGEVDCMAALNALGGAPASPLVQMYDFVHGTIQPGSTVTGTVRLQNLGANATSVTGTITGTHPSLTIINGTVSFGSIAKNAIVNSATQIQVHVSDTVTEGTVISLPFKITGTGFQTTTSLAFIVEPTVSKMLASHTGLVDFTLSNYGVLGLGPGVFFPAGGYGFNYNDEGNDLLEGGIIVGNGVTKVSSGVHSYIYEPDMDFKVAPGGNIVADTLFAGAVPHTSCAFTDANAASPLGLHITQESFSFPSPKDDHILLRYVVRNTSGGTINGVRFGIYLDWDIVVPGFPAGPNAGGYDTPGQFAWMAYNNFVGGQSNLSRFRGIKLVQGQLATALTSIESMANIPFWPGGDGFTTAEKYLALANGMGSAETFKDATRGLFQLMAAAPKTLAPGASDTLVFALIAGDTYAAIGAAAQNAVENYYTIAQIAPSQVTLLYPPDTSGSTIDNLLPTFQWTAATDPNPGNTITYTLQYALDSLLTSPTTVNNLTVTSHTVTDSLLNQRHYWWRVVASDNTGLSSTSSKGSFATDVPTDVPSDNDRLPKSFALFQNYPNPFNPGTAIAFDLPRAADYQLTIFDITGRVVYQQDGRGQAGRVVVTWNAAAAASGVYLYKLTAGAYTASRKMLLLK